jgi:Zn-dependent membrane protease YugP
MSIHLKDRMIKNTFKKITAVCILIIIGTVFAKTYTSLWWIGFILMSSYIGFEINLLSCRLGKLNNTIVQTPTVIVHEPVVIIASVSSKYAIDNVV